MIDYTSNLREVYLDVKKGERVINYPDTYQGKFRFKIYKDYELECYDSKYYVMCEETTELIGCNTRKEANGILLEVESLDFRINHHQEEKDKEERPWRHGLESYKSYYS